MKREASTQAGAQQTLSEQLDTYNFIVGSSVDRETVERAQFIATAWGVDPHDVMLALGWITPEDYVAKLAAALQVDHIFEVQP
ncbi:MAG: hypothetical protein AAGD43_35570, partial [Pseudomonadota bacterium]